LFVYQFDFSDKGPGPILKTGVIQRKPVELGVTDDRPTDCKAESPQGEHQTASQLHLLEARDMRQGMTAAHARVLHGVCCR
jgi:hypothetical protein